MMALGHAGVLINNYCIYVCVSNTRVCSPENIDIHLEVLRLNIHMICSIFRHV
jgi:hypothetical protein